MTQAPETREIKAPEIYLFGLGKVTLTNTRESGEAGRAMLILFENTGEARPVGEPFEAGLPASPVPGGTEGLEHDLVFAPPASLMRLEKHLPLPTTFTDGTGAFVLNGVTPGLVLLAADDGVHLPFVKEGVPTGAAGGGRRYRWTRTRA